MRYNIYLNITEHKLDDDADMGAYYDVIRSSGDNLAELLQNAKIWIMNERSREAGEIGVYKSNHPCILEQLIINEYDRLRGRQL